jgi:hypothetical protein
MSEAIEMKVFYPCNIKKPPPCSIEAFYWKPIYVRKTKIGISLRKIEDQTE